MRLHAHLYSLFVSMIFTVVAAWASPHSKLEQMVSQSKWRSDKIHKSEAEWKSQLSSNEYEILRKHDTEAPFSSAFVTEKQKGAYVCGACGLKLFSAEDKFDSGTGWPSFTKPSGTDTLYYKTDESLGGEKRIEVLCARCGSHLGHVFPRGHAGDDLRYCINGGALKLNDADEKE